MHFRARRQRRTQNGERFILANGNGVSNQKESRQRDALCAVTESARGTRDGHIIELAHGVTRINSSSKRISRPSGMRPTGRQPSIASHATVKSYCANAYPYDARPRVRPAIGATSAKDPVKAFGLSKSSTHGIARYRWYLSNVLNHGCPPLTFLKPKTDLWPTHRASGLTRFQELQEIDLIGFIRGQVNYQDYQRFERRSTLSAPDGIISR